MQAAEVGLRRGEILHRMIKAAASRQECLRIEVVVADPMVDHRWDPSMLPACTFKAREMWTSCGDGHQPPDKTVSRGCSFWMTP